MNVLSRRCLILAAAWGVTPASAAVPVDLLLPSEPVAQPGNVQVGSFNTFVYGDSGDLVFSASSFVPGGSALDRIFRLRAGQTQLEVIGFSQTSVDGVSTFISFFDGMTDGGVAYTYDGRVLATGPDLTPPFTAVLGPNSPIIGLDPSAQNFGINAPA